MNKNLMLYSLTYPQKGIWFVEKLHPNTSIGNISATYKIERDLDVNIFEEAINLLIKKNDAFQTRIIEIDREPMQYFADYKPYKLDFIDFRNQDIENLYQWDSKQSITPFKLIDSKLYYFALVKFNQNSSGFYTRTHHLISDGWSLVNFGNQVMEYYDLIERGQEIPEENHPSYIEYILREQEYVESEKYQRDCIFWNEKSKQLSELTVLKTKKSNKESLVARRKTFFIPEKLCIKIRQHCLETNSSIFALLFSALCIYINRITFKEQITIGVPVLNRTNKREKDSIGMYISTVPLSVSIENDMDFIAFSKVVFSEWMSVLKRQRLPYDEILKFARENNKGVEKLFDIAISYQNNKFVKESLPEKQEGRWHFNGCQTESLYIHINDREDDGCIVMDYDFLTNVFFVKEIEFIHDHILRLLWHALDNTTKKLPFIHMISEKEKNKVIYDFNDTQVAYPKDKTIHELFEMQVARNPNNIALAYEDYEFTYSELNKKANQVAVALREKGVGPDSIVAIMMQRSHKMIIGILGIIKAGGCYLPVDNEYPIERKNYLFNDSNAKLLICDNDTENNDFYGEIINIDDESILLNSDINLENINKPNDLLYIIYTSGSTGNPKGVMLEHGNCIPLIINNGKTYSFNENDVWALFHSFSFDVSVWEMYGALLNGAKLVVIPKSVTKDPKHFLKVLKKREVTVLSQIPVALYNLINVEMLCTDKRLKLRYVFFGGDALNKTMLKSFKEKYFNTKFINMYGVTETAVADTIKEITNEELKLSVNNIGKPLPTSKIYILDKMLNPVPIGVMGEIYIGGSGVSRGYLNKPELTKEKFIVNPFVEGERIYKSGDFARWFPLGDIEFLGRMDSQVKIRGHRIELEEIERNLLLCNGVSKAVVIAREDSDSKKFLCAYIVTNLELETGKLKGQLMKELPLFMVPACFVKLDFLPTNANGKVDLKALPEPIISSEQEYIAPRNEKEEILANIWGEILRVKNVGIDDNFFELGGDSLGTVQFISALNKINLETKIQDIYEYPTIRDLSKSIREINNEIQLINISPKDSTFDLMEINFAHSENMRMESRPISEQILSGEMPLLDSASLSYIPEDLVSMAGVNSNSILAMFGDKPVLYHTISSSLGNIGLIIIPMFSNSIYADKDKLISKCIDAIQLAKSLGARVVSLTGLIPSATTYGEDIKKSCEEHCPGINVTTGHTTTASSVILSVKRLLDESGRNIRTEKISVLGLGSVGSTVIKLLLSVMPHPSSITLFDIQEKMEYLTNLKNELINEYGYKNSINISVAKGPFVGDEIYDSTLIIGATNVPNILDVDRLRPGTLIIDDSGPHCFNKEKAIKRLKTKEDILFTEGGVLEAPFALNKTTFLPQNISEDYINMFKQHFFSGSEITGCILSGLLSAQFSSLEPLVGFVTTHDCCLHYNKLSQLDFKGAHLHCDEYILPKQYIENFKNMYGEKLTVKILATNSKGV